MVKFILGLVIGVFVGIVLVGYDPDMVERVQDGITDMTGIVLRGTEEAAETVGDAAREAAGEAEEAAGDVNLEEAAEETGQAVEDAAEGAGEALEDAGQAIEREVEDTDEQPAPGGQ